MAAVCRYGLVSAVALALVLLCSGTDGSKAWGRSSRANHTVIMEGVQFSPSDLTVKAGDTETWINRDPFPHTATADGGLFDSHAIEPERSWRFTPKKAGVISYGCTYHPTMKGTLRIE